MDRRTFFTATTALAGVAALSGVGVAAGRIALPEPSLPDVSLAQALQDRRSQRSFSPEPLTPAQLSGLLWSAFGVNRPDQGKRTAPSALNWQEIDVYAVLEEGTYWYDAKAHALEQVREGDLRPLTGRQGFVADAPLNLVYVADYGRMADRSEEDKLFYSAADTGFISQNVYLFCAAAGLATVVRNYVDKPALAEAMGLMAEEHIVLTQTVGQPG